MSSSQSEHAVMITHVPSSLSFSLPFLPPSLSFLPSSLPPSTQSSYVGQQLENTAPGATVLTVTATDDDQGSNAVITYSLVGGATDQFRINPSTGAITNAVMLVSCIIQWSVSVQLAQSWTHAIVV